MLLHLRSLLFLLLTVNGPPEVKLLVQRVESRYRSARTLQATFLERYLENGNVVRVEAGIAYFRRPGKMRWEYQSPEKNLFLVDGKSTWFYVPADHTVTRVPAKDSSDWKKSRKRRATWCWLANSGVRRPQSGSKARSSLLSRAVHLRSPFSLRSPKIPERSSRFQFVTQEAWALNFILQTGSSTLLSLMRFSSSILLLEWPS